MQRLLSAAAVSLLLLAACADHDGAPGVLAPDGPRGVLVPNIAGDDTDTLRALVAAGGDILLDTGTYTVSDQILITKKGTRIHGQGRDRTIILMTNGTPQKHVFRANHVDSIRVDSIGFRAGTAANHQFALTVYGGNHIRFENNGADNIGLFKTGITSQSESSLARNVVVRNNVGRGQCGTAAPRAQCGTGGGFANQYEGIYLAYVDGATVSDNSLRHYSDGIMWWGTDSVRPAWSARWARNIVIENDTVRHTVNGIWGAYGRSVTVRGSTSEHCADVCLDAERSDTVNFFANNVGFAGGAAMAVFFDVRGVLLSWNRVEQNGTYINQNGQSAASTNLLFRAVNPDPSVHSSMSLANNTFIWSGVTGHGVVTKEYSETFIFANNTLTNSVLDLQPWVPHAGRYLVDAGAAQINGNSFSYDRYLGNDPVSGAGIAAIHVGNNHLQNNTLPPPVNAYWHLEVGGNTVTSTWRQDAAGIRIRQTADGTAKVNSLIQNNEVSDFTASISVVKAGTADHHFWIGNNGYSGTIPALGSNNILGSGNYWIAPTYTNTASDCFPQDFC